MRGYIVDSSALARVHLSHDVARAVEAIYRSHLTVFTSPVLVLERSFSGESLDHFQAIRREMDLMWSLDPDAVTYQVARRLQERLAEHGMLRAAGVIDLTIAATAIQHDLQLVHYDADFEHIAAVSELNHRWVVARGSADGPEQ